MSASATRIHGREVSAGRGAPTPGNAGPFGPCFRISRSTLIGEAAAKIGSNGGSDPSTGVRHCPPLLTRNRHSAANFAAFQLENSGLKPLCPRSLP